jgi:LAS superfamily LD-carboxypeptidase LdcB
VPVTSGYRSPADQTRLWLDRARNPFPVAPPGTSMHERGLAVDVPLGVADRLAAVGAEAGLCRPYPVADPVHFELC